MVYTIGVDKETKEKLRQLGNLSMSGKIRALIELCERHKEECIELMKKAYD